MNQLTSATDLNDLISQHEYSLLYFSASWCGPCKSMSPIVEGISSMMSDRFNTVKIDIDSTPVIAANYGIRSVPTMMLVKGNKIIDQRVGGLPPQQLMQWLQQHT